MLHSELCAWGVKLLNLQSTWEWLRDYEVITIVKTEDSQYDYADLVRLSLHCEDIQNTDIQSKQEIYGKSFTTRET